MDDARGLAFGLPGHINVRSDGGKTHATGHRYFIGFSDDDVDDLLGGLGERVLGSPDISVVVDGWVAPLRKVAEGQFTGGVSDASGYLPALALHRGHGERRHAHVMAPRELATREEPYLRLDRAWFGGYLFDHFGHFLLEGLARVLSPEVAASEDPVLFLSPTPDMPLSDYVVAICARIGIDPARITLCGAQTLVEELWVQEPTFEIRGYVRPDLYQHLKRPEVEGAPRTGLRYLSRRRLTFQRMVRGEDVLEERLALELGAEVVHPERLPMEAQIETVARSRLIAGCEGSAFHSLMFVGGRSLGVMFCNRLPHMNYLLCDELFDGDIVYVRAVRAGADGDRHTDWEVDADLAVAVLGSIEPR